MAEAAVEGQRPNKFFCHQCSREIEPDLPEFTCPTCQSGFIEEMSENSNERPSNDPPDPATQFAELWGRAFLDSLRMHTEGDGEMDDGDDDDPIVTGPAANTRQRRNAPPRTSFHIRQIRPSHQNAHPQPIDNIMQQLISSLTARPLFPRQGIPFGGMFNMYGNPGDYAWGQGGLDSIITQLLNQLEGQGPPPASKEDIDTLSSVNITQEQVDKTLQCSVCMEDFKLDEKVKQLPCDHHYHLDCIVPWLERHGTCPVCRKTLKGQDSTSADSSTTSGSSDPPYYSEESWE